MLLIPIINEKSRRFSDEEPPAITQKTGGRWNGERHLRQGVLFGLHPAITFVLYFGEEEWDGAKELHGIIDFTGIPEKLRTMVPNYQIQLIEVRKLEDTSVFQTDVRQVFDFIRCAGDKEKLWQLVNSDAAYRELEEDAYDMVMQYTGADDMMKKTNQMQVRGGRVNMYKSFENVMEECRIEGRVEMVKKLLSKGYNCVDIADMFDMEIQEIEKIQSEMLQTI